MTESAGDRRPDAPAIEGQGGGGIVPPVELGRPGRALGLAGGVMIVAMMAVTTVDVIGRYVFAKPIPGAFEVNEILMGLVIFVGLPLATAAREQITVNFLEAVVSDRTRRWQAGFADLVCAFTAAVMAWRIFLRGQGLISVNEVTLQLGAPRGVIAEIMAILCAATAVVFVASAVVAFRSALRTPR